MKNSLYEKEKEYIKKIGKTFVPKSVKLSIIDSMGIENIVSNFEDLKTLFSIKKDENYIIDFIIKNRYEAFISYMQSINIKTGKDLNIVKTIIEETTGKTRREVIKSLNLDTFIHILLKTNLYNVKKEDLYSIREEEVNTYLDSKIQSNTYEELLDFYTPNTIVKYIIDHLDDNTIINDLLSSRNRTNYYYTKALNEYASTRITNHLINILNNDPSSIDAYYEIDLPKESYIEILNRINITDDFISLILNNYSRSWKEALIEHKKEVLFKYLMEEIHENTYMKYLKGFNPDEIIDFIINNIDKDQIREVLKESYLYNNTLDKIYDNRKQDLKEMVIEDLLNNPSNLIYYRTSFIEENVLKGAIKTLKITQSIIESLINLNSLEITKMIYKAYPNEVLSELRHIMFNNKGYLSTNINKLPEELVEILTDNLSNEDLYILYASLLVSSNNKDIIYRKYKDKSLELFFEYLITRPSDAITILESIIDTKFRQDIMSLITLDEKLSIYSCLTYDEKEELLNNKEYEDKIKEKIKSNPGEFYKNFISHERSKLIDKVVALLDDDDIVNIFKSGTNLYSLQYQPDIIKLFHNAIMRKRNELRDGDYKELVLFLKGLRYDFNEIFIDFIKNITMTEDLLYKLSIERGLADEQKIILYKYFKDDMINTAKIRCAISEEEALEYLQKGTPQVILNIALNSISKDKLLELLNDEDFLKRRSVGAKFASKLALGIFVSEENRSKVESLLDTYTKDKFIFIKNYESIIKLLETCNINPDSFFQYSLNSTYDYAEDMASITDLDSFKKVYDYLTTHIFEKDTYSYNSLLTIVKNYIRYKDLCLNISNMPSIEEKDISNLLLLFNQTITLEVLPSSLNDCINIVSKIREEYEEEYLSACSIDDYKNIILNILFNANIGELNTTLYNYGTLANLLELKYYNASNKEVLDLIEEVEHFTYLIEYILDCNSIDYLKEESKRLISELEIYLSKYSLDKYEEKMRKLYSTEMNSNLSKINDEETINFVKDAKRSNQYGVEVYDLSDKKYTLLAHVLSSSEKVSDLMNGVSSGTYNYISMSAVSYRNQNFYWGGRNIIFGYDELPIRNFICSSIDNMGTNYSIKKNSLEVDTIIRTQRGVKEISDTEGNSEVLCLREGLCPRYIIVPGREPNAEEIEVAKDNNLIICITQSKSKTINNPITLPCDIKTKEERIFEKQNLNNLKNELIAYKNNKTRRIAILTDIHGLLEPTIQILESIRRKGITEIYSLGDNIGNGPNPSEVLDLLKLYGVTSLKGNHEIYTVEGLDRLEPHLRETNAYDEEVLDSAYQLSQIREDQIEDIKSYQEAIEISIGNELILLCHYPYDYNTGEALYDFNKYDRIICGHKHFRSIDNNITTIKAAGMGNQHKTDIGSSSYIILEESPYGINEEEITIPYEYKNTLSNINESESVCKEKMRTWIIK